MIITLTEAALGKLKSMEVDQGMIPRIDADMAGGCGISVSFRLIFDAPRKNDTVIEYDGIYIHLDRFTKRNLDEETQIDFNDETGFQVGESFASSACAIELA